MEKVKIGLIGCGNMAQMAHIPALLSCQDAEIKVLCDPRKSVADKLAAKWGIAKSTNSEEELLKSDVDAVYVLTPVQCHEASIKAALSAGKHVFTEKPSAMCAESASKLDRLAKETGKSVIIGYMKRHEQNILKLKEISASGEFGKMLFIRTHSFIGSHWDAAVGKLDKAFSSNEVPGFDASKLDFGPSWLKSPRDKDFYSFANPFYGLLDTGCHSVNFLRFLTGKEAKVTGAFNSGSVRLVDFDFDGVPGKMEFCVNFAMHRWDEVTEIYYEKGTVKIFTPSPLDRQSSAVVEIYSEDGDYNKNLVLESTRNWAFKNQTEAFINIVKSGKIENGLKDSEKDIEIIENIYKFETGDKK